MNGRTLYKEFYLYFPLESLKEMNTAFILDSKKNIVTIIDLASKKLLKLTLNVKKFFEYQEDGKWFDGMESEGNIFFMM